MGGRVAKVDEGGMIVSLGSFVRSEGFVEGREWESAVVGGGGRCDGGGPGQRAADTLHP